VEVMGSTENPPVKQNESTNVNSDMYTCKKDLQERKIKNEM